MGSVGSTRIRPSLTELLLMKSMCFANDLMSEGTVSGARNENTVGCWNICKSSTTSALVISESRYFVVRVGLSGTLTLLMEFRVFLCKFLGPHFLRCLTRVQVILLLTQWLQGRFRSHLTLRMAQASHARTCEVFLFLGCSGAVEPFWVLFSLTVARLLLLRPICARRGRAEPTMDDDDEAGRGTMSSS